jgi:hypothetical protein
MTWGFNFAAENLTLATIELKAILNAFSSHGSVEGSGVNLKLVELGNEPDLYGEHGRRAPGYDISDYVSQYVLRSRVRSCELKKKSIYYRWRHYINSLLSSTSLGSSFGPMIQALSFGNSDFGAGNFSPEQAIMDGIFDCNIGNHIGV